MKTLTVRMVVLIALSCVTGRDVEELQEVNIDWTGENQCFVGSKYDGPGGEPQLYLNFDNAECRDVPGGAEIAASSTGIALSSNFELGVTSQYADLGTYDPAKFCFVDASCPNGFSVFFNVMGGAGSDGGVLTTVYKGDQAEPNVGLSITASGDKFAVSLMTNTPSGGKAYYAETTPGTRDTEWTSFGVTYDPSFVSSQCPDGFEQKGDFCYKLDERAMFQEDAENACNQYPDGNLASFHSAEQFGYLTEMTDFEMTWSGAMAFGDYSQQPMGVRFTDGTTFDYTPPGGFAHAAFTECGCIHNGKLIKEPCNQQFPFICQVPIADNKDLSFNVYINGQLDANDDDGPTDDCCTAYSNYRMLFGASYTNELNSGLGSNMIDELLIYDRALSAQEVQSLVDFYE